MAGTTTHAWILYRALSYLSDPHKPGGPVLNDRYGFFETLASSHENLIRKAKSGAVSAPETDEHGVLASCAYIGSSGPDLFYVQVPPNTLAFIADLLHYNRSGPFVIRWLSELRKGISSIGIDDPATLLKKLRLAYCLGHISHIAADIAIHPYVNSFVGAYPQNKERFRNPRGDVSLIRSWKFHNIVEHYQDAYVWSRLFREQEGFGPGPEHVNLAYPAARRFRNHDFQPLQFTARTWSFYRYHQEVKDVQEYIKYLDDIEMTKYGYFCAKPDSPWWRRQWLGIWAYYQYVLPDLTGGPEGPGAIETLPGLYEGPFQQYLTEAVALTLQMWCEAARFLSEDKAPDFPDAAHRLSWAELSAFPLLGRHWNLDCGLAPRGRPVAEGRPLTATGDQHLLVPAELRFESIHELQHDDWKRIKISGEP